MITEVIDELDRKGLHYEVLAHSPTQTARQEARATGVPNRQVAKTIVLAVDDGYARAVLPASERLDLEKARVALSVDGSLRLATETELGLAYPAFELGAVPPFAVTVALSPLLLDDAVRASGEVILTLEEAVQFLTSLTVTV